MSQECGCKVLVFITDETTRIVERTAFPAIDYCPLHLAAPALLEAAKKMEQCASIASKEKGWSWAVAQALIPGRDALYVAILNAEAKGGEA